MFITTNFYSDDDDIRLHRLILASLNERWACHPDATLDDVIRHSCRANKALQVVEMHLQKDRADSGTPLFPIAPVNLNDVKEL